MHWLKVVNATRDPLRDEWLADASHGLLERVRFPRNKRPTGVARGDRLVYYSADRRRFFAVVEVISREPYEDRAQERWPYVLDVRPRLLLPRLDTAPALEALDLPRGLLSVRRQSHIRLDADQYTKALAALVAAAA